MTDKQMKAHNYFKDGYNCAQAALLPFADIVGVSEEILLKMSAAFGGGFAKTRNICGAVSAIGIVVGFILPQSGNPEHDKTEVYRVTRLLIDKFTVLNTTIICSDLLKNMKNITNDYIPTPRTEEYYRTRPCVKFVMDAVAILEDYINESKNK